ncbi:MAG: hypothetical protein JNK26_03860 [Candidatus Doudnabacteria bacterium]|nr:hypothetical protein [Candidatus Doudnabacteria bacterium]
MSKPYTYQVTTQADSKIKVVVKSTKAEYDRYKDMAYTELAKDVKLPGFRPGKAPRAQVESKIANELFSATVKKLLSNTAAEIIDTEGLNPLTQLDYDLTKASDTEIEFTFEFTNYPEIKLGDFSKLSFGTELVKVEEKEIDEVIQNLFTAKDAKEKVKIEDVSEEMVAGLKMEGVSTVAELRKHIEKRLQDMKQSQADNVALEKLIEAAVEQSTIPVPEVLVEDTVERQVHDYIHKIEDLGMDPDEFLKAQGKSRDSLKDEKKEAAKKQIQQELLMTEIVRHYKVMPTPEDIEKELNSISDPQMKAEYDSPAGRRYITSVLIQRRALDKLKEVAKVKKAK